MAIEIQIQGAFVLIAVCAIIAYGFFKSYGQKKSKDMGEEIIRPKYQRIILDPRFENIPAWGEIIKDLGSGKFSMELAAVHDTRRTKKLDYTPGSLVLDNTKQGAGTNAPVRLRYIGGQNGQDTVERYDEARRASEVAKRAKQDTYREMQKIVGWVEEILAKGKPAEKRTE